MPKSSFTVESALRTCLSAEGFTLTAERVNGETGVDILATRGTESLHIEVIGFKDSAPARAKDFFEIFFRAISRLRLGATRCVIALPSRFGNGLQQRAANYGVAWSRLGDAFPELEIWLVDSESTRYVTTTWNEWLRR